MMNPNNRHFADSPCARMNPTIARPNRSGYWDSWKGLAILAVVALHSTDESLTFPIGSTNWYFGLALCQLLDFAVPLFLALAGFFAGGRAAVPRAEFYRKRLLRILPPYVFWTAIAVLLNKPADILSLRAILGDLLLGRGIEIGYFVVVLLQYVLITPLILMIGRDRHHILAMVAITVVSLSLTYAVRMNGSPAQLAQFPFYALPFFIWYPFYHLGIVAARKDLTHSGVISRHSTLILLIFLMFVACAVLEGLFLAHRGSSSLATSQIKASSFMASISLFLFSISRFNLAQAAVGRWRRFAEWLGGQSYPIYLMHLIFLRPIGAVLRHARLIYNFQPLYVLLSVAFTLAACIGLIRATKFALPTRFQARFIGIG
jgi:surface polysaccharide O-acyltransferase-like enzyme